jgi:hypothetical protein
MAFIARSFLVVQLGTTPPSRGICKQTSATLARTRSFLDTTRMDGRTVKVCAVCLASSHRASIASSAGKIAAFDFFDHVSGTFLFVKPDWR